MDPVTAFGLAVNVLAVVEFSKLFLEILGQVRDFGSSTATHDTDAIIRSLQVSNAKAFRNLVDESQKISEELLATVEDVRAPGSSTLSTTIKVSARTMWNCGKIEQKKSRLAAIREQLLFDMVVPMASKVDAIPDNTTLDRQTQTLLDAIRTGQDTNRANLEYIHRLYEDHGTDQHYQHAETVSLLNDISLRLPGHVQSHPIKELEENKLHRNNVLRRILRCLYYHEQYDRQDDIEKAHQATFEWIYNQSPTGATKATWSDFQTWLVRQHGIYWMTGKAGSGKSTLMKFLSSDPRMLASLSEWAAGDHLVVLSFYFWNPGTRLQKSLEGLFKSILRQALEKCPGLAEKIFPDRFECSSNWGPFPTMNQLKRAFAALTTPGLTDAAGISLKVALMIDGLDEFDAGPTTLADLAEIFTSAATSPSFKALLSSRPENAFEDAFERFPKLRLHHLTEVDVVKYVNDKIHHHPRMLHLASQSPKESVSLVSEIVQAAQGVFLWVKLVVRSLSEGLQNHDDIFTLTARLRELPTDLEDLFRHMLLRIPGRYKRRMSLTFQLLRSSIGLQSVVSGLREYGIQLHRMTALDLKFALLDVETVLQSEISQLPSSAANSEMHSIEVQVKSHCAGLVELSAVVEDTRGGFSETNKNTLEVTRKSVSSTADQEHDWVEPKLQFIHRSVTEYLWKEDVWKRILEETEGMDFHPRRALLQSLVMQAKKCPFNNPSKAQKEGLCVGFKQKSWTLVWTALEIEHELETKNGVAQLEMLDTLEASITTRCGSHWWHTHPLPFVSKPLNPIKSISGDGHILVLAVCHGLWRYVQARLQAHGPTPIQKAGRPLLNYACEWGHEFGTGSQGIDVHTVEALLLHGASPNETFNGCSPWQTSLREWRRWSQGIATKVLSGRRPPEVMSKLLPILKVFVTHGANPNAYIEENYTTEKGVQQTRRFSVLLLLERSLYGGWEPDLEGVYDWDVAEKEMIGGIIKSLKEKGAKAKEWKMVGGVFVRRGAAGLSTNWKNQSRCTMF